MINTLSPRCSVEKPLKLDPLQCEWWRGSVLESVHEVHAALVNEEGRLLACAGDPSLVTTARSSLKPFQLLPTLLRNGRKAFSFTSEDIAFMCASHNGEDRHSEHCKKLLAKIESKITDLECGAQDPYDQDTARALYRAGIEANAIHNNCSGKHCGMLALKRLLDAKGSYLGFDHPVQTAIFECVESLLGYKRAWQWGIDGCSLPTPAITLIELATLFAQLAAGRATYNEEAGPHLELIYQSMSTFPNLVAGSGRFDTAFMRAAKGGAICKVGGEAIRSFAIREATGQTLGLTLKVTDGAMRALHPACLAFLEHIRLIERPLNLHKPSSDLNELDRFWKGVETNCAGREATLIEVKLKESIEAL